MATILIAIAIGAGVAAVGAFALPLLGFGSAGVAAGSTAAGIHSSIGVVAAGSAFATAQSAGTGAALFGTIAAGVSAAAAFLAKGACFFCIWWIWKSKEK